MHCRSDHGHVIPATSRDWHKLVIRAGLAPTETQKLVEISCSNMGVVKRIMSGEKHRHSERLAAALWRRIEEKETGR